MTKTTTGEIQKEPLQDLDPIYATKEAVEQMIKSLCANYVVMYQNLMMYPQSEKATRERIIELWFDPDKRDYTSKDFIEIAKEKFRSTDPESLEKFKEQFTKRYYDLSEELYSFNTTKNSLETFKKHIDFFRKFLNKYYPKD